MSLRIHRLGKLHGGLSQRIGLGRDRARVVAFQRPFEIRHRVLDLALLDLAEFRAMLGELLLGRANKRLAMIFCFHSSLALLVVSRVCLRVIEGDPRHDCNLIARERSTFIRLPCGRQAAHGLGV